MLRGIPSTQGDHYPLNTTMLIKYAAQNFPHTEVVYRDLAGGWQRSNYAQEFARISQIAHALDRLGIGAGDMVGVLDWNSRRHFELYFAVPGVGATMLQLNLRLAAADLQFVLDNSQAKAIFVDESLLPIAHMLAKKATNVRWIIMSDRPAADISTELPDPLFFEDLIADEHTSYDWQFIAEDTAAYAGYTTGTTGQPKGVYYSHRSIVLHTYGVISTLKIGYTDCCMPVTPMFHVLSWGFPQAAVGAGAKLVLPGRYQAEDLAQLGQAMAAEEVTVANGAPAIFAPLLEYFRGLDTPPDLSRARLVSGSSEPPLSLMRGWQELTGANVIHAYGATETTPLVTTNWHIKPSLGDIGDDAAWDLKRNQGVPVLGVEMKIVDPTGTELPWDGETMGELLMRGPWITESYHGLPDSPDRFDQGWWRSGDVAVFTPGGYLKLTDRLKDVIKSGGEWISSIDMENAILDDDRVKEAAVIGVPDEKWDERPVAYIVARPGTQVTAAEVVEALAARFAKWQLPDEVILTDELPRTSVGKLDKKVLRSRWES